MGRPPRSQDDLNLIQERFLAGEPLRAIAADFGVTIGRVGQITRAMGLRRYAAPRPEDPHDPESRFWAKVNKDGPILVFSLGRCWEWIGSRKGEREGRYGNFWFDGRIQGAHRVAFFLKHGRWPEPQCLHRCDNAGCVRWDHLFEGTQADNIADMYRKGRDVQLRGEAHVRAHGRSQTSDEDVRVMRAMREGGATYKTIAERFKVSIAQAYRICSNEHWRHL